MDKREPSSADILVSWNFPEFPHTQRSNAWYLWFGIIAGILIIASFFTDNFLFAVIIILFGLILFLQNWRKPAQVNFTITPQGLYLGNNFYRMSDVKEFWLVYRPGEVEMLFLEFEASWRPLVSIPLQGQNPLQLREILIKYLPENLKREDEPIPDSFARLLKL